MADPLLVLLHKVKAGPLVPTGVDVAKALAYPGYIQVIGKDGSVLSAVKRLDQVAGYRLTRRGKIFVGTATVQPTLSTNQPLNVRLWASAFRRWARNCPDNLALAYSEGQLHVLSQDAKGEVKNDPKHRVTSVKVRWVE